MSTTNILTLNLGLASLVLSFLLIIVLIRWLEQRKRRQYLALETRWEEIFFLYLEGALEADGFPPVKKKDYKYWEWYLYDYMKIIQGEDRDRIVRLAGHSGLLDHLYRQLREGNRWKMMGASRFLGATGEEKAIPLLRKNLAHRDSLVSLAAARGLAASGKVDYLPEVVEVLLGRSLYTYEAISEILVEFGPEVCPFINRLLKYNLLVSAYRQGGGGDPGGVNPFENQAYKGGSFHLRLSRRYPMDIESYRVLCLYIDILAFYNYLPGEGTAGAILRVSNVEEVLIHCLKYLGKVASPGAVEDILPLLQREDWVIRSQAARALGTIDPGSCLAELEGLLGDENWWVRFRAAEAMALAGEPGIARLEGLARGGGSRESGVARHLLESL